MTDWPWQLDVGPLDHWTGRRTAEPRYAPFRASLERTLRDLQFELDAIDAEAVRLLIDMLPEHFRVNGRPRATAKADSDGIVLVVGKSAQGPLRFPCDTYLTWQGNLRAIALGMNALRAVDRYGITKSGEQYQGWKEITSGRQGLPTMSKMDAIAVVYERAGLERPTNEPAKAALDDVARMAKKRAHPDQHGGNEDYWNQVDNALQIIREHEARA